MQHICDIEKCSGCYACVNICPNASVEMRENAYGFLYPEINQDTCVNCGLCVKTCPMVNFRELNKVCNVYACINNNESDYNTTTSGGVATLFARKVISQGGVVYGVAMDKSMEAKHIRVTEQADIELLKGSKYVYSTIGHTYSSVKSDLLEGKKVLFIGRPCQIDGLKNYLGKEYTDLFTCDLICHGVPSTKFLKEHINNVCGNSTIDNISFRDKQGFYLTLREEKEVVYRKRNFYDVFYMGFLKGLLFRDNCYHCRYAQQNRVGDITLGDFWGFDREKKPFPVKTTAGLSLVMINTINGKKLFEECQENMIFQERTLEEAINGNKQLRSPSARHRNYQRFNKNYLKYGFDKAAKYALWKERLLYAILGMLGK